MRIPQNSFVLCLIWLVGGLTAVTAGVLADGLLISLSEPIHLLVVGFSRGVAIIGGLGALLAAVFGLVFEFDNWSNRKPRAIAITRAGLAGMLESGAIIGAGFASVAALLAPEVVSDVRRHHPSMPQDADQILVVAMGAFGVAFGLSRWWRRGQSGP